MGYPSVWLEYNRISHTDSGQAFLYPEKNFADSAALIDSNFQTAWQ